MIKRNCIKPLLACKHAEMKSQVLKGYMKMPNTGHLIKGLSVISKWKVLFFKINPQK